MAGSSQTVLGQNTTPDTEAGVLDPLAAEKAIDSGIANDVVTADNIGDVLANLRAAGVNLQHANFAYLETDWKNQPRSKEWARKSSEDAGFEKAAADMVAEAAKREEFKGLTIDHVFDAWPPKASKSGQGTLLLKSGRKIRL